jgi:[ribosomal protein S5]-alanine N-acetyltransferase
MLEGHTFFSGRSRIMEQQDQVLEFPVLETERLVLREIYESDAAAVYDYFSKEEMTRYYNLDAFTRVEQAEELVGKFREGWRDNVNIRWAITLKGDGRLIGTVGFHNWMKPGNRAELGYELHPDYWGQGLVSEAVRAAIAYGIGTMCLYRIGALLMPENVGSAKVLLKNGFRLEGRMRGYLLKGDAYYDADLYSLLRDDAN